MKKYEKIATDQGMPLFTISKSLAHKVNQQIQLKHSNVSVKLCMRYGRANLKETLDGIKKVPQKNLVILPLFPQYSATTTASIFDEVTKCLRAWNFIPNFKFIRDYCNETSYIEAIKHSIEKHWAKNQKGQVLLFSYHGLPEKNLIQGDPYSCYCHKTTRLVAESLNLKSGSFQSVFQSRFGPSQWLKPYTEQTIITLAKKGIQHIDIVAPSFAVDCLETIDEIKREYEEIFLENGGISLNYIDCLNDSQDHIQLITKLIEKNIS